MKNRIKLIVMLSVITIVAALFSGCFLANFGEVKSISLVGTPKNVYYVGDEFDASGFQIKIDYKNEKQESEIVDVTADQFDISFSSAKEGTYKCVITLKANANVSLSFDYSVMLKGGEFTEGDGSKSSPYVVYTAEQFSHIGETAGKYYVLGDNIDFTKATPVDTDRYGYTSFNAKSNSFVLDGQGYSLTVGGKETFVFKALTNGGTIKNLIYNVKTGSREANLCGQIYGEEVVFEEITLNGSMENAQNSGLLAGYFASNKVLVKNCTNNVNITGTATRGGAFFGLASNSVKELTFDNCVNNGNIEGGNAYIFIGNCANTVGAINVINCRNNGRLVGGSAGLFNCNSDTAVGVRITENDYKGSSLEGKIKKFSFTCNTSDFVAVSGLLVNNKVDTTLVKDGEEVKFNTSVKAKLDAEFGEGNYVVEAYVRDWVKWQLGSNNTTVLMFTKTYVGLDFVVPYKLVENSETVTDTVYGAITIADGKLVLSGTYNGLLYKTQNEGKYQNYCYFVYEKTDSGLKGAMKYCGQIAYADVQNA